MTVGGGIERSAERAAISKIYSITWGALLLQPKAAEESDEMGLAIKSDKKIPLDPLHNPHRFHNETTAAVSNKNN